MKIGRNDPCSCGSGKKFKKCCLAKEQFKPEQAIVNLEAVQYAIQKRGAKQALPFNRIETGANNYYLGVFGHEFRLERKFNGFVKVKLAHGTVGSIVVPDLVIMETATGTRWLQPFGFLPNHIFNYGSEKIECVLYVDFASGRSGRVIFESASFIRKFQDGSELYRCLIEGPADLESVCTGLARFDGDNRVFLNLFHHTKDDIAPLIVQGKEFRTSAWNIQGTKEFANLRYLYLTSLPEIRQAGDLVQIAMASDGRITLIKDNFYPPDTFRGNSLAEAFPNDALELVVYRESTENRTSAIAVGIASDVLAPQHLHFHRPKNWWAYYSICCPFIHRVGVNPGKTLGFSDGMIDFQSREIKEFQHIVVGDCTEKAGLLAPYDEDTTEQVFKIEVVEQLSNILKFWFEHGNRDLFSSKKVDKPLFQN